MSAVLLVSQVPLPGYLLHEVVAGATVARFRACALITSAVWSHGFDATCPEERDLWCQLYLREMRRRAGGPVADPEVVVRRPRLPEIRRRSAQDRTLRHSA